MKKVTAYKARSGAPLETDPLRAYAWEMEIVSEKNVSFGSALWILNNADTVRQLLDEYEDERDFGAKHELRR